ncbi:MAG: carbohydrate ABC transporter permease [Clostridia bacterium]|nr:carbohydrate ABC transporter permease [Clostridia bacterium]
MTDRQSLRMNTAARTKRTLSHMLLYLVLICVAATCFFPFLAMLIGSTQDNLTITTKFSLIPGTKFSANYERMMQNKDIWRGFFNSLWLAVLNTCICLYFSALTGYAFSKFNFRGRGPLFAFILVVMMLPGQLGVIGFYREISNLRLLNTYWPLILPTVSNCFAVFFFKQYLDGGLPNEMIEAALIDGCGEIMIYHRIVLPCMGAALVTQGVMSFIGSWNSYLNPLLVLNEQKKLTLPVLLASIKSGNGASDYGAQYVGILISVFPLVILFSFANKVIMEKISIGAAVKG